MTDARYLINGQMKDGTHDNPTDDRRHFVCLKDLKDRVLLDVYNRVIRDLKSS